MNGLRRWAGIVMAGLIPTAPAAAQEAGGGETVEEAICRLIETSARARDLPVGFLTRLIWRESSFRTNVVSSAGAQGVAQFMPGTARERGLADPFDPEAAIPASAAFLADLKRDFGNLGLAAAAYNAGPGRVRAWLAGRSGLPSETITYVARITAVRPTTGPRPERRARMARRDRPRPPIRGNPPRSGRTPSRTSCKPL